MEMLFWLLVAHAISDFSLQTDTMAKGKNKNRKPDLPPPGAKYVPCWPYWLSAHALIHGGAVGLVTGIWWFGTIETAHHWIVDFYKCKNLYGVHADQFLHISIKVIYVILISIL